MNILLLGSGGRECAIAWKLSQSNHCNNLFIAPGNAGTAAYGKNIALSLTDFDSIKNFCIDNKIDMLFPGGEDTLVVGIYDYFKNDTALKHIIVAGPSQAGAQLEGSKAFSKNLCSDIRSLRLLTANSMSIALKRDCSIWNSTTLQLY